MARHNREILTGGKKYAQNKAKKHAVEEVTFDKDSRNEYLTGFHKRKLERQKKAQEFHKEQDRLARIEQRKQNKLEKQKEMSAQLDKYAKSMKELSGQYESSGEEDNDDDDEEDESSDEEPEPKKKQDQIQNGDDGEEFEEWSGFDDDESTPKTKGILKRVYAASNGNGNGNGHSNEHSKPPDAQDDDEDEGTTVTIEDVEMNNNLEEIARLNYVNLQKSKKILDESIDRAKKYAVIAGAEKPKKNLAQKKKKFRYLTKTERRANNRKAIDSKKKSRNRD